MKRDYKCLDCGDISKEIVDFKKVLSAEQEKLSGSYGSKTFESLKRESKDSRSDYNSRVRSDRNKIENKKICPNCASRSHTPMKRGFSVTKAVFGGLIGGAIGSNNIMFVCNDCGTKWNV